MSNYQYPTEYYSVENESADCPSVENENTIDGPYEEDNDFEEQDYYDEALNNFDGQGQGYEQQGYQEEGNVEQDCELIEDMDDFDEAIDYDDIDNENIDNGVIEDENIDNDDIDDENIDNGDIENGDSNETEEQEDEESSEESEESEAVEQLTIELGPDSLCPGGSKAPVRERRRRSYKGIEKNTINPNTLNYQRKNLFISYRFTCYECSSVFSSETQLKKHLRDNHKILNHRCHVPRCKQSFKRE